MRISPKRVALTVFLASLLLLTGCAAAPVQNNVPPPEPGPGTEAAQPSAGENNQPVPVEEKDLPASPDIPPGPLPPNEAGQVMVLMYHQVGEPEAEWRRTPENLRQDLDILYREGYRLISLQDYASGQISLPSGYSPVVLTFDDGTPGQFNLLQEGGRLVDDPQSAVGILNAFAAEHPDFGRAATFFVFYPLPFGQKELLAEKFRRLQEYGMEIGNHTLGHQDLARLEDTEVQRVLAEQARRTAEILPGYRVHSLALPYGSRPKNRALAQAGEWQGASYRNDAVLLVGANPAPSPFSTRFNQGAIPRIRASDPYLAQWLAYFRSHPERRYVSDGNPRTITVPEQADREVNTDSLAGRTLVIRKP